MAELRPRQARPRAEESWRAREGAMRSTPWRRASTNARGRLDRRPSWTCRRAAVALSHLHRRQRGERTWERELTVTSFISSRLLVSVLRHAHQHRLPHERSSRLLDDTDPAQCRCGPSRATPTAPPHSHAFASLACAPSAGTAAHSGREGVSSCLRRALQHRLSMPHRGSSA